MKNNTNPALTILLPLICIALICPSVKGADDLIASIKDNRLRTVKDALASGADPNTTDQGGWTGLHWAAEYGFLEMSRLLCAQGAAVDGADEKGTTALHRAVIRGHKDLTRQLLDAKANVGRANREGKTAIHLAAQQGRLQIIRLLLTRGARVNAMDEGRLTALDEARFSPLDTRQATLALLKELGGKTGKRVRVETIYRLRKEGKLPLCRGFLDAQWGMIRQQVIDLFPDVSPMRSSEDLVLETKVTNRSAKVLFHFPEGRLTRTVAIFSANYKDPDSFVDDYRRLKKMLTRKYGKPENSNKIWKHARVHKSRTVGASIASGDLTMQTVWETDWTRISLTCESQEDRYSSRKPQVTLAYQAVVTIPGLKRKVKAEDLSDL